MTAVLLLHGQPGGPADWQFVAPLIESDEVLIPERPGYGESQMPPGGFAHNARAMVDLLDSRGIRKAIVVGYSWGGGVAIQMAAKYPKRVAGLVLVSSIGPGAVGLSDHLMVLPGLSRVMSAVAVRLGWAAFSPSLRAPVNLVTGPRVWNAARAVFKRDRYRRLASTFIVEQKAFVSEMPGLIDFLPNIAIPTSIVHARNDLVVPFSVARALSVAIPGSQLSELSDGFHYLPHRRADDVALAVNLLARQRS